ncbi:MAG TPA: SPFH domain-containing protein [Flavobacteriales bacterium]|nr:SPFH domain-containing protein [Flavobacteriales bacterium]HRJ36034.1 SPFH domain-containing protein [Flavobacteriales bacterium]HRJ37409.1 SPFH domain-containing protein [Flavobacteriales bacterium]
MGLWDKIKGQLIDIIEWLDTSDNSIAFRFERQGNEIKNGAKLIVRESQVAVFQNEGEFADVFQPGTYTLETQNMPILSTLKGWKYGFNSPFKAEVIFVNTKVISDLRWGTKGAMTINDMSSPLFRNTQLKAFGSMEAKVVDPKLFIREVMGTDDHFTKEEIVDRLRTRAVSFLTRVINSDTSLLPKFGSDEVNEKVTERMNAEFAKMGMMLNLFTVESHEFDADTKARLERMSAAELKAFEIRVENQAKADAINAFSDMNKFQQFQAGNAMEAAANNPNSGDMGSMMGAGMGFAFGQTMMNQQNNANQQNRGGGAVPPPLPGQVKFFVAANGQQYGPYEMQQLQQMVQGGQLTRESMVWKEGMAGWLAAGTVPELSSIFGAVPPPPPPPPMP